MAGSTDKLNSSLKDFIKSQPLFFVATAAPEGRVNLSPKGLDSLRIIDDHTILWLNLTGSGNETAAHLLESERMTLMFCGFTGTSRTIRVFGSAKTYGHDHPDWELKLSQFPKLPGARQIFELKIDLITDSCGSSFPRMEAVDDRASVEFTPYWAEKSHEEMAEYWQRKNRLSIDGKPTGI